MKDHCQQIKSEEVVCYYVPVLKALILVGKKSSFIRSYVGISRY